MTAKNTPQIIPSFIRQLRKQYRVQLHAFASRGYRPTEKSEDLLAI
jgi:hypothetical protein